MTRQQIYLTYWDWVCLIFYEADIEDAPEILHRIMEIGCGRHDLMKAGRNLLSGDYDIGLTFSSYATRMSVMVIGRSSSPEEFQNTFDHEKGHLARHICLALDIDPYGEEAQYLAGAIGEKLFASAKKFMCQCDYGQR